VLRRRIAGACACGDPPPRPRLQTWSTTNEAQSFRLEGLRKDPWKEETAETCGIGRIGRIVPIKYMRVRARPHACACNRLILPTLPILPFVIKKNVLSP